MLTSYGDAGAPTALSDPLPAGHELLAWTDSPPAVVVGDYGEVSRVLVRREGRWAQVAEAQTHLAGIEGARDRLLVRVDDALSVVAGEAITPTPVGWVGPRASAVVRGEAFAARAVNGRVTTHRGADALVASPALDATGPLDLAALLGFVGDRLIGQVGAGWQIVWALSPAGAMGGGVLVRPEEETTGGSWEREARAWGDTLVSGDRVSTGTVAYQLETADALCGWFREGEALWRCGRDEDGRMAIRRLADPQAPRLEPPVAVPGLPVGVVGDLWVLVEYWGRVRPAGEEGCAAPARTLGSQRCLEMSSRLTLRRRADEWAEVAEADLEHQPVELVAVGGGAVYVRLPSDDRLRRFDGLDEGALRPSWTARTLRRVPAWDIGDVAPEARVWLRALPDGGAVLWSDGPYRAVRWDAAGRATAAPRIDHLVEQGFGDLGIDVHGDDVTLLNGEAPVIDVWLPLDAVE